LGNRDFVLAVGSLTADKRYPFLVEVVSKAGAPLLVICGDGPLRQRLQEESAAFRMETRFLGMVTPDLLRGAYSAARCLVHACEIETFGLSVLEAMACACPVIAVDAGAIPEVLGETGTLVAAGDPDQFAGALEALLAAPDRERAIGLAEQQRAGLFSLARMQQEHVDAIEAAC
jgi:glycosyltransferase involved in cell wall biosynthesis